VLHAFDKHLHYYGKSVSFVLSIYSALTRGKSTSIDNPGYEHEDEGFNKDNPPSVSALNFVFLNVIFRVCLVLW
jgi:hypothetical protein